MTLIVMPPLDAGLGAALDVMTSLDAFKFARECIGLMAKAHVDFEATRVQAAQLDAMEAHDTARDAVVGLFTMLEHRGVLADIEGYLIAVYGRV